MQADMEIHNAAKLPTRHWRRDSGAGARSALHKWLCAMSTSTSGALAARPAEMGFMRKRNRTTDECWRNRFLKIRVYSCPFVVKKSVQLSRLFEVWLLEFLWMLDVGAWSLNPPS